MAGNDNIPGVTYILATESVGGQGPGALYMIGPFVDIVAASSWAEKYPDICGGSEPLIVQSDPSRVPVLTLAEAQTEAVRRQRGENWGSPFDIADARAN